MKINCSEKSNHYKRETKIKKEEIAARLKNLHESYTPFEYGDAFGGMDGLEIDLGGVKEWLMDVLRDPDAHFSDVREAHALLWAIA